MTKHSKTDLNSDKENFLYFLVYFMQFVVPGDNLLLGRNILN